jgi:hypothetical protein
VTFAPFGQRFDHGARLVRADDTHARRFPDDRERRLDPGRLEIVEQTPHAHTADLLVERKGEMHRPLEVGRFELRQERQRGRDEPLHVSRAAPIELVLADLGGEWVARPLLPVDRDHIAVTRKHIAAVALRSERREQVRLAALFVMRQPQPCACALEQRARERDQLQVGIPAHRVERDQPFGEVHNG